MSDRQYQLEYLRKAFPAWDWHLETGTTPDLFVGVRGHLLFEVMPPIPSSGSHQDNWQVRFGRQFPYAMAFFVETVEGLVPLIKEMPSAWYTLTPLLLGGI